MPPLLSLVLLTGGVALGALVLRAFLPMSFVNAAAAMALIVLGVPLAATLGERAYGVDYQRRTLSTFIERTAREKCLADLSRPDVVGYVSYIQAHVPPDATYLLAPRSRLGPCLALNLLPRRPVPRGRFDDARDWLILEGRVPRRHARNPRRLQFSRTAIIIPPTRQ
jgi:hypothetical protein